MPKAEGLHTYLVTCCHRNASLMLMPFMALNPQGDLKNKQMNKKTLTKMVRQKKFLRELSSFLFVPRDSQHNSL